MNTSSYDQSSPLPREEGAGVRGRSKPLRTILVYLVLISLLYLALRNAPFAEIWSTLSQLRLWQIGVLFIINSGVICAIAARWWIIVRSENRSVPFLPLVRYRLSTFGISYFTPGPQVGGEPLQVYYLQKNHGLTFARSTSAVIMDKLIELLGNSVLIVAGLTAAASGRDGLTERDPGARESDPDGSDFGDPIDPFVAAVSRPVSPYQSAARRAHPSLANLTGYASSLSQKGWQQPLPAGACPPCWGPSSFPCWHWPGRCSNMR